MTVATLGLAVESSDVRSASPELDRLTAAAGRAEAAATALTSATNREAAAQQVATGAARMHAAALQAEAQAARLAASQRTNLVFQLQDIGVSLASGMNPLMVLAQQGSQISTIYGPGGLGKALQETGNIAVGIATKFWPVAAVVGGVSAAIAGMTAEINKTSDVTVTFGDTALATWQVISQGIYDYVQPGLEMILGWASGLWENIRPGVVAAGNGLIAWMRSAVDWMTFEINSIPDVLTVAAQSGANGFIAGIEWMVQQALAGFNSIISGANDLLKFFGADYMAKAFGWGTGQFEMVDPAKFKLGRADIGGAAAADRLTTGFGDVTDRMKGYAQDDVLGDLFGAISGKAQENARARELAEIGEGATKAAEGLKAANDNGQAFKQMLTDVAPLLQGANDPLTELQANMDKLGALLAAGEISWEQYGRAAERANAIAAAGVLDSVSQITGVLAGAFKENQALQAANVVVDTAAGVMKAYSQGGMFATPMALAIAAAGAVQLGSILSAKPGSASVATPSASAAAAAAPPSAAPGQGLSLTIVGTPDSMVRAGSIAELIERINEYYSINGQQLAVTYKQA